MEDENGSGTGPTICAVGEAMLELSRPGKLDDDGGWRLCYGGDTLNTAVHLARYGFATRYLTALGLDPFSDQMCADWEGEGLDVSLIQRDPLRPTGLYAITTDAAGERSFTYWRSDSAARRLFTLEGAAAASERAARADVLFYSLITLAILPPEGRDHLFELARKVRKRGGKVVFDGNYRPKLWANAEEAQAAKNEALKNCDLGLPTLEDERALWNATSGQAVADHWRSSGANEVLVKLGAAGSLGVDGVIRPPPELLNPVDTSGAGDAFNAGYLAVWLAGGEEEQAISEASRLAGWVIMRRGAIPPAEAGFRYRAMEPALPIAQRL